jgi:hypothetical protein
MGASERESVGASASPLFGRERRPRRRAGRGPEVPVILLALLALLVLLAFFFANRRLHQLSYAASSRCIRMNLEDEGMYSEALGLPKLKSEACMT